MSAISLLIGNIKLFVCSKIVERQECYLVSFKTPIWKFLYTIIVLFTNNDETLTKWQNSCEIRIVCREWFVHILQKSLRETPWVCQGRGLYKAGYTLITKYVKTIAKCEKWKCIAGYFVSLFSHPFFHFSHFTAFALGPAFMWKVKDFILFFRGINKTRNSHEIRKVYSECFVFCGVFRENIREILVKCEIQRVYSRPNKCKELFFTKVVSLLFANINE